MLPPPRRSISGAAPRASAMSEYALTSSRQPEAFARGLDERESDASSSRGANAAPWTTKSSPPNSCSIAREDVVDLRVVGDVAGQDQRIGQRRGELAHVLLEPLALIGHRQPRACARCGLRDRPRDRPLVGHADDEARLAT